MIKLITHLKLKKFTFVFFITSFAEPYGDAVPLSSLERDKNHRDDYKIESNS